MCLVIGKLLFKKRKYLLYFIKIIEVTFFFIHHEDLLFCYFFDFPTPFTRFYVDKYNCHISHNVRGVQQTNLEIDKVSSFTDDIFSVLNVLGQMQMA